MQIYNELKSNIQDIRLNINSKLDELIRKVDYSYIYENNKAINILKNLSVTFKLLIEKNYPSYFKDLGIEVNSKYDVGFVVVNGISEIFIQTSPDNKMFTFAIMRASLEFCAINSPGSKILFGENLIRIQLPEK